MDNRTRVRRQCPRPLPPGQHSSIERIFGAFYRRLRKGTRKKLRSSSSEESGEDSAATGALAEMRVTDGEAGTPVADCAPAPLTTDGGGGGGGAANQVAVEDHIPADNSPSALASATVTACEVEDGEDGEDDGEPLPDFFTPAELQQQRVEPRNLRLFCDRLSEFVRYVQRVHDLARATYDHPAGLQRRLERDLAELRALLAAVRDAVATVQRLRAQRSAVRKEKAQVRKHLRKLREEEVREMESIVAVYDKAMFARWENVRHTHKPDALNALLNDVKGKQQAMENLSLLIQRKQAQLQGQSPSSGTGHGGDRERASATALDAAAAAASGGGGVQSPAGAEAAATAEIQPPKRHAPAAGSARTVALRRRRHHERQQDAQSAAAAAMAAAAAASRWDPELPLPLALPAPSNTATNASNSGTSSGGTANAVGGGSGTTSGNEDGGAGGVGPCPAVSSPSLNPCGTTVSDDSDGNPGSSSGGSGSNAPGRAARAVAMGNPEFQNEMRGVLQALFGDLRLGPVANLEDIDLFAVRSSQASNRR